MKEKSKLLLVLYDKKYINQVNEYKQLFGKFQFVKYGIDYIENSNSIEQILPRYYTFSREGSICNYDTIYRMLDKYGDSINMPMYIATNQRLIRHLNNPNIHVLDAVVLETFCDVIKNFRLLVLSMKDDIFNKLPHIHVGLSNAPFYEDNYRFHNFLIRLIPWISIQENYV